MSLVYEAVCDWWDESVGEVFGMDNDNIAMVLDWY